MSTNRVRDRLSQSFTQSLVAMRDRQTQAENQQTFSGTYLGNNQVQLANGDIRRAYNQGTKEVLQGESVTVTFPLHSHFGFYTSKIS
jgi:hypothetical protein